MVDTRGGRRFAVFFLLAAFLVLLLGRWIQPVDNVAETAAAPFAAVVSGVSAWMGDSVGAVFNAGQLRRENAVLKAQNAKLIRQVIASQTDRRENRLYRSMLKFEDTNAPMKFLPARVIWLDPTGITSYLMINKGSKDGLRQGMSVVDQNGFFVGSISRVAGKAAQVLLLENPSSSVGAVDQATRATGLVEGSLSGPPQFRYVVTGDRVRPNDLIVTSGQLNLFPRNLLIGQVAKVSNRTDQLFQTVEVRPAADIRHLEMVQVIRGWAPSVPAKLVPIQ